MEGPTPTVYMVGLCLHHSLAPVEIGTSGNAVEKTCVPENRYQGYLKRGLVLYGNTLRHIPGNWYGRGRIVAKAPDGNGGVYSALKYSRLLEDMATRGVRYLDCYGVDNALVRVADPTFLGYFIDKGVAAAAKVVRKAYPQEKVGVFVRRGKGGPLSVVEYSELDSSLASAINQQTGRLRFCWSNVCLHMFTLDFLNQVANGLEKDSM
ncbi:N-acetylglucosamine-1-phosphate uridylyltransferase 2 [Actinidia rufa]|uniref:UDP-N-acetylglucosamine diphosphorylase n=1 Tax=Actinidia rufa TaxID=165716 RepID=A0A7J0DXF2_9ERIC|nr:N-acetylglucosamine-1-phosphate uridylyltransferase 2 [Actinidia rufa]